MILPPSILTQSFGSPSTFRIVCASALVASNMKAGAQGACNTVNELDSVEGRVVALGRRSGGAWEPDSRTPIKYGTAFHLFRLSERRVIPSYPESPGAVVQPEPRPPSPQSARSRSGLWPVAASPQRQLPAKSSRSHQAVIVPLQRAKMSTKLRSIPPTHTETPLDASGYLNLCPQGVSGSLNCPLLSYPIKKPEIYISAKHTLSRPVFFAA